MASQNHPSLLSLIPSLIHALVPIGGVIFLAIGFSGLLVVGFGSVFGKDFISGERADVVYTSERCADYFEFHPEAQDCRSAATAHHYDEVVDIRGGIGVLGAIVLIAYYGLRRRLKWASDSKLIPKGFSSTVAASLCGAAALLLLGVFAMQAGFGNTSGAGVLLSGGLVSAVAFLAYATQLSRDLLRSA
ncbi:MAG: hypothetical protein QF898_01995 [SAR202 cluster bacterium]|nr:hypothetical protein [SAR202 cluster bacterium]MDP6512317.1 hypothetical protein [SAR202 cluster bacterium]MDP6713091.1 hypothetical protein [SAR202 cluster bacterium]